MRNMSAGAVAADFDEQSAGCTRRTLIGPSLGLAAFQVDVGEPSFDLWGLRVADIPPSLLADPRTLELLSEKELARHARFRFHKDKDLYLAKRVLVRGALSQHSRLAPQDWVFASNGLGRPSIADQCDVPGLHFSLASSSDLALCLITAEPVSGVDVEDTLKPDASEALDLILSVEERFDLELLPPHQRRRAILQYWTLKEAYLKARGTGINLPLGDITFRVEHPTGITVRFPGCIDDDPERWHFQQRLLFDRYLIATAIYR